MAVDANVLIFERLREEQLRGLSLRMALRNAYDRAFSAILDGNVTTGITAARPLLFGSRRSEGLRPDAADRHRQLAVHRAVRHQDDLRRADRPLRRREARQPAADVPQVGPKCSARTSTGWARRGYFYAFSVVFIVVGLIAFGVKLAQGQMLDIEFATGTSVAVRPEGADEDRRGPRR